MMGFLHAASSSNASSITTAAMDANGSHKKFVGEVFVEEVERSAVMPGAEAIPPRKIEEDLLRSRHDPASNGNYGNNGINSSSSGSSSRRGKKSRPDTFHSLAPSILRTRATSSDMDEGDVKELSCEEAYQVNLYPNNEGTLIEQQSQEFHALYHPITALYTLLQPLHRSKRSDAEADGNGNGNGAVGSTNLGLFLPRTLAYRCRKKCPKALPRRKKKHPGNKVGVSFTSNITGKTQTTRIQQAAAIQLTLHEPSISWSKKEGVEDIIGCGSSSGRKSRSSSSSSSSSKTATILTTQDKKFMSVAKENDELLCQFLLYEVQGKDPQNSTFCLLETWKTILPIGVSPSSPFHTWQHSYNPTVGSIDAKEEAKDEKWMSFHTNFKKFVLPPSHASSSCSTAILVCQVFGSDDPRMVSIWTKPVVGNSNAHQVFAKDSLANQARNVKELLSSSQVSLGMDSEKKSLTPRLAGVLRLRPRHLRSGTISVALKPVVPLGTMPLHASAVDEVIEITCRVQWTCNVAKTSCTSSDLVQLPTFSKLDDLTNKVKVMKNSPFKSMAITNLPHDQPQDQPHDQAQDQPQDRQGRKPKPKQDAGSTNGHIAFQPSSSMVWFHFLYHHLLQRCSELRRSFTCPWCNLYAATLEGLVAHLVCSHDHFQYQVDIAHDGLPHIAVMPFTVSMEDAFLPNTRRELVNYFFCSYFCRKTDEQMLDMDRDFGSLDEKKEKKPRVLENRQYFHSRTGGIVLKDEADYDSDDDVDEEWILQQSERLLDEFEDVSLEEKEFMKMWNRHAHDYKIVADFHVPDACLAFAHAYSDTLIRKGLRHNFLFHLFNLWDNSLLNEKHIVECMTVLNRKVSKAPPTQVDARKESTFLMA